MRVKQDITGSYYLAHAASYCKVNRNFGFHLLKTVISVYQQLLLKRTSTHKHITPVHNLQDHTVQHTVIFILTQGM